MASLVGGVVRGEDLAASVAGRLRESGALAGYKVNVKAKSGTVWLEGRVADEKQLAAAVGIAESSPGVERVVNRLAIEQGAAAAPARFGMPTSTWSLVGGEAPASKPSPASLVAQNAKPSPMSSGLFAFTGAGSKGSQADVQLVQAQSPAGRNGAMRQGARPLPMGAAQGRPMQAPAGRGPVTRTAMRTNGMGEPMTLPAPGGYDGPLVDGQMVPGTMQYSEGAPMEGGYAGGPGGGYAGGPGGGAPMAMGGTGVGMPPVPMRGDGPNMPNYAWPSYAANPNYAAVQYPTQYSPTAWPYIGPFYPYPQVPLGWRRVSLEWDDGWWWLDFDERHIHSHHR
jgi:hypothetical protein